MDETNTPEGFVDDSMKQRMESLTEQAKAQLGKTNRIARQILQIMQENELSIADMEQVFTTVKNFSRLHARVDFDPEAFDAFASPQDIFSMGMSFFGGGGA